MKTEMIGLSPAALFGVWCAGIMLGGLPYTFTLGGDWIPRVITVAALLFYCWHDAREGWKDGIWKRGWLRWTYQGPRT